MNSFNNYRYFYHLFMFCDFLWHSLHFVDFWGIFPIMNGKSDGLGARIRDIRKLRKMNQGEFGEILGIKRSAVSKYENGESSPDPESLAKIAELGEVTIDWLVTGKEKARGFAGPHHTGEENPDHGPQSLNPDEKYLLDAFRRLSSADRYQMLRFTMEIDTTPPKENGS